MNPIEIEFEEVEEGDIKTEKSEWTSDADVNSNSKCQEDVSFDKEQNKCGEIFVSKKGDFTFLCVLCEDSFTLIKQYKAHVHRHRKGEGNKILLKNQNEFVDGIKQQNFSNTFEINKSNRKNEDENIPNSDTDMLLNEDEIILEEYRNGSVMEIEITKLSEVIDENDECVSSNLAVIEELNPLDSQIDEIDTPKTGANVNDTTDENICNNDSQTPFVPIKRKRKTPISQFYCKICERNAGSAIRLERHNLAYHYTTESVHLTNKPNVCKRCNKSFASQETLTNHIINFCTASSKYGKYENYSDSLEISDNSRSSQTNDTTTSVFAEPINIHPLICRFCHRQFKVPYKRIAHELLHTGGRPFKCEICGKCFRSLEKHTAHIMMHKGMKPHKCHLCDAAFTIKSNLNVHIRRHLGVKCYKCDYCDMQFVASTEKKIHERTHTGEKPYKCEVCGKTFAVCSWFIEHLRKEHSAEKSFKCDECSKAFYSRRNLKEHITTHLKEKPFECEVCNAKFCTKGRLNRHMKIHMATKGYLCSICGKSFNHTTSLSIHMRTHNKS